MARTKNDAAWIVTAANPGRPGKKAKKRRAKARRKARRSGGGGMVAFRTKSGEVVRFHAKGSARKHKKRRAAPAKARRHTKARRRSNPALTLHRDAKGHFRKVKVRKHRKARRRRNPGFLGSFGAMFAPIKENAIGFGGGAIFNLFVMDPLLAHFIPSTMAIAKGPAKMLSGPLLAALGKKVLKSPAAGRALDSFGIFMVAIGVNELVSDVLSTPQSAVKGLADAWSRRGHQGARQGVRGLGPLNGLGPLGGGQRQLQSGLGGIGPTSGPRGGLSGLGSSSGGYHEYDYGGDSSGM
jgi:hypothetical protein